MKITITILSFLICVSAFAQEKLTLVQQAMKDELDRNIKELQAEGFDKPFFINYTLLDQSSYQMSATLGALVNSMETKNRIAISTRLLVGDYELNDESVDNNLFSQPQANDINLPIDDDYLGIRRSLWISTDNVYRNASRQYAKNKELVKETGKPLAELPHRTFAKVAPSKVDITAPEVKFDKSAAEDYIRKVSEVFKDYKDITDSGVGFMYRHGYRDLVNSEGSINRVPVVQATLFVTAMLTTKDGHKLFNSYQKVLQSPELPPLEATLKEARAIADGLEKSTSLPAFEDEYSGPVLFEGEQLANLFYREMFTRENSLTVGNNIPPLKGVRYESNFLDTKIGKPLFADGMTVKAMPKLKSFEGVPLIGSFDVDSEGVIPADETVLVENGVLKEMCNDRTITRADQKANGLGDGPGVVSISFKSTVPVQSLKTKLIEHAKKEGLDYAIRVAAGKGNTFVMEVYKVYVADGREELMRNASMGDLSPRNFKKIVEASKEMAAHHIFRGDGAVSVICPQGVIFEEVEISGSKMPTFPDEQYVSSPLKK